MIGNRGIIPGGDKTRLIHKVVLWRQTKGSEDCYISCWKLLVSEHVHCYSLRKYRYFRVKCAVLHLLSDIARVVCVCERENVSGLKVCVLKSLLSKTSMGSVRPWPAYLWHC